MEARENARNSGRTPRTRASTTPIIAPSTTHTTTHSVVPGSDLLLSGAEDHTALYLTMVDSPPVTRNDLIRRGFDGAHLEHGLQTLVERGLIRAIGPTTWEATPPEISLPAFAAQLEHYAQTIRNATPALSRTFQARQPDPSVPSGYQQLESVDAVALATQRLLASTDKQVWGMRNDTEYTRLLLSMPVEFHATTLRNEHGNPITSTVVLDSTLLSDSRLDAVLQVRSGAGETHRFANSLPFSVLVNDRGSAVIDVVGADGGSVGLSLQTPEGTASMIRIVKWAWQLAQPWKVGTSDVPTLDPKDRRVLQLLAAGRTDTAIAKKLGISQRTVERRVRGLMDRVGANTRFEAGVLAAKAGLI